MFPCYLFSSCSTIRRGYEDSEVNGGGITDFLKSIPSRIFGVINGTRYNFRPQDRKILEQDGNEQITLIKIVREPVHKIVNSIMNGITLGKFNEIKKEKGYDSFFHLFLIVQLSNNKYVRIEKNEVIALTLKSDNNSGNNDSMQTIPQNHPSLNQFLKNTENYMGQDKFFKYDGVLNNCQDFVLAMLQANGLLSSQLELFIKQDVSDVPFYSKFFAKKVTDLAHRANIALDGMGIN